MKLIATATASGSSGTLSFVSIPSTFTDIVILLSGRNSLETFCEVRPNGATTGLSARTLSGSGGGAVGSDSLSFIRCTTNFGGRTANTFGSGSIYFPNYAGSTAKSVSIDSIEETNGTSVVATLTAGLSTGTAAISSIDLVAGGSGIWVTGTIASLYGITKGSDGIVTTTP